MADSDRPRRRIGDLAPDPEMWAALDGGPRLSRILAEFYAQVFADPSLAPFFEGRTQEWIAQKQYSFLCQIFTGAPVYFGDRPRNAHHWMVIDDALFDRREALMADTLRRHGLPEHLVARWLSVEEIFRKQIVKATAVPKKLNGMALPLEGYEQCELSIGGLCDACTGEIELGAQVWYHVRTGKTFCVGCYADPERR